MPTSGDLHWTLVPRHIMEKGGAPLRPLVVVSSTKGWGKTTWMRQYEDYVREHSGLEPRWLKSRTALLAALSGPRRSEPKAVFADLVLPALDDPLWADIVDFAEENPQSIVVVSSIDRITPDMVARSHAWEVWEQTLGLTRLELEDLVKRNAPKVPPREVGVMFQRLRGHPYLVRRHLERVRSAPGSDFWTSPEAPTERLLIRSFQALGSMLQTRSYYLQILLEGSGFRRFDLDMLRPDHELPPEVRARQFERLQMSPLGTYRVDPLTGRDTFEWTPSSWRSLQYDFPSRRTPEARDAAYWQTLDSGAIPSSLFYLLDLGRYDEAETLVCANLRLFVFYTPQAVEKQLTSLPREVLKQRPNLAILTGELLSRAGRRGVTVVSPFQDALDKLKLNKSRKVLSRYRVLVRLCFASVSLGERQNANRYLDNILELLGTDDDPGPALVAAVEPTIAKEVADQLFFPLWAAMQLDRHRDALRLATFMRAWGALDSTNAIVKALAVATEEALSGTPASSLEHTPTSSDLSDALLLLDQGRGREALELVRGIDARRESSPTRSVAESLVLTVRALEEPETLAIDQVQEILDRSSNFWTDGVPSTFIAHSATLAYLALQRPYLARTIIADHPGDASFTVVAAAVERLASGYPGEAAEILANGGHVWQDVPRASAIMEVLAIAAFVDSGQTDAARLRLNGLWMKSEASLIRYALRLVPQETFQKLYAYRDTVHEGLKNILDLSAMDPHVFRSSSAPSLTRSEAETLELLRSGRSYPQIAEERFVSLNTVRTQVRALYRKLGVSTKADAVTTAEQLGLLR